MPREGKLILNSDRKFGEKEFKTGAVIAKVIFNDEFSDTMVDKICQSGQCAVDFAGLTVRIPRHLVFDASCPGREFCLRSRDSEVRTKTK